MQTNDSFNVVVRPEICKKRIFKLLTMNCSREHYGIYAPLGSSVIQIIYNKTIHLLEILLEKRSW